MPLRPLNLAIASWLAWSSYAHAASYTYHGDLMDGDTPAEGKYDLRVRAFAHPGATQALGEPMELPNVVLREGRFGVELDIPEDSDGTTWVEVAVRKTGSGDDYAPLGVPQPLARANSTCPGAWALDGNSGMPAGSFLGTVDANAVLELKAGDRRAARIVPAGNNISWGDAPNIALGSGGNLAGGAGIAGATVAGGGAILGPDEEPCSVSCTNRATANFSTVGGGQGNHATERGSTIAGGHFNRTTGDLSTVGGGSSNAASGPNSTAAGGSGNSAAGHSSTVAGGATNEARADRSAIGGGHRNTAAGVESVIAGGVNNCAGGRSSWAGGKNAKVRPGANSGTFTSCDDLSSYSGDADGDEGSFVWADSQAADFLSNGPNQFLLRSQGGVGINRTPATADMEMSIGRSHSSDTATSIALGNGAAEGYLSVYSNGNTELRAATADLVLVTAQFDKFIYTNDKFGVAQRPVTNALEVAGNASKSVAGGWLANSDRRIKRDVAPIPDALDTILRLRPVTFHYDSRYRQAHPGIDDKPYYNVIAQEFAQVFPDAVKGSGEYLDGKARTPDNEILQVDTYPAQIVSIAAIQELAVQAETLQRENDALRASMAQLMRRMERIESGKGD
jgi:trimeric autotransporter adhesin